MSNDYNKIGVEKGAKIGLTCDFRGRKSLLRMLRAGFARGQEGASTCELGSSSAEGRTSNEKRSRKSEWRGRVAQIGVSWSSLWSPGAAGASGVEPRVKRSATLGKADYRDHRARTAGGIISVMLPLKFDLDLTYAVLPDSVLIPLPLPGTHVPGCTHAARRRRAFGQHALGVRV